MDELRCDPRRILVTGAAGNVGRYVVRELAAHGHVVLATDLRFPFRAKWRRWHFAASGPRANVEFHPADLTDVDSIATVLRQTRPQVIIHLAAVIPPFTYEDPELSHHVNVDGTRNLVHEAQRLAVAPYFIQASSMAVYGARNPHRHQGPLEPHTPTRPTEIYGAQKLAAEQVVRSSSLDWSILRLGGVLSPDISPSRDRSLVAMEGSLPLDGRVHTVAVEDVAVAFEQATALRPVGDIFMIGGDRTHRLYQHEVGEGLTAAMGLRGVLPTGRPGDPEDDRTWFVTDWLDTLQSQQILKYQRRSFDDVLMQIRRKVGWRRWIFALLSPLARRWLARSAPYVGQPGRYADPWSIIAVRWGWPLLEPDPNRRADQAGSVRR